MNFTIWTQGIVLNENGIKKIFGDKIIPWDEILYKINKKNYPFDVVKYTPRGYRLKNIYSFYQDDKLLFKLDEIYDDEIIEWIQKKFINTNIVKELKKYIDGEEIIEITVRKDKLIEFIVIGIWEIFLMIALGFMMNLDKKPLWYVYIIFAVLLLTSIYYIKKELSQHLQKIYLVKNKGIYIEKFGNKKFYKFEEIDDAETEYYINTITTETVEHTIKLYKNNKEIIFLTDSNSGFYEFLNELKNKRIIKQKVH